jgi:hypothetical protein
MDESGEGLDEIVRFDVAREQIQVLDARLPGPRWLSAATHLDNRIHALGGVNASLILGDDVVLDVRTEDVRVHARALPTPLFGASIVSNETRAHVFGGYDGFAPSHRILALNVTERAGKNMTALLPGIRMHSAAVWTGSAALLFGGLGTGPVVYSDIVAYHPSADTWANNPPVPVLNLTTEGLSVLANASATRDPEGGNVTFLWTWGDGTPAGTGPVQEHAYVVSGRYLVMLNASDSLGNSALSWNWVTVGSATTSPPSTLPGISVAVAGLALGYSAFLRRWHRAR